MRKRLKSRKPCGRFLLCLSGILFLMESCGVVAPPIPPEDIGIEAKIRAQKKVEGGKNGNSENTMIPLGEESVPLPPLQPVMPQ